MNKYEIRTNKKKEAIVKASMELFRKKGYTATSINEIASIAKVSGVSIYNYYGSKEVLVKECATSLLQDTIVMVDALMAENISFQNKLLRAVALCTEKPHEVIDANFSKEALDDKIFFELLNENMNKCRTEILSQFIESGKKEGAVDKSIPTDIIISFLGAVGSIQLAFESKEEHQEKVGKLYHLALYGLIGH